MSRAAYPAEESLLVSQTLNISDELFCAQSSNLNLTTRVRSNLDYDTLYWFGFDRTNVRFELPLVPGSGHQARETKRHNATSAPPWLGIKLCLSSLAAARDKAQQTQTRQQHGIGFGFGDRAANDSDLPMVIDSSGLG